MLHLLLLCTYSIIDTRSPREQIERHALVMQDRFDPGSTISIMALQRSYAGISIHLNEDLDEEKDIPGEDGSEPLLGSQQSHNPISRLSTQKIVFEGNTTEDSRYSTACTGPQRVIEAWLMGAQLPQGADYDASVDAFQVGSSGAWCNECNAIANRLLH